MKHPRLAVAFGMVITALAFLSLSRAQQSTGPVLSVSVTGGGTFELLWPRSFQDFVLEGTDSLGTASNWQQVPESNEMRGTEFVVRLPLGAATRFFRLRQVTAAAQLRLLALTPNDGATEVGVTVRPKVTFSEPVNPTTLTAESFFVTAAGTKLDATIVPANDGSFAWLFFKDSMPGGTRVRVTVDGEGIRSASGASPLDADGDGTPGGVVTYEFTTVSVAAIPGTVLAGRVVDPGPDLQPRTLDDIGFGAGGIAFINPIAGVKVHLIGLEEQSTVTDATGWFQFDAAPVGDVKVVLDGKTATTPHPGFYWPEMVMDTHTQPGRTNYVEMIGQEPGALSIFLQSVYLPRIASNILQTVKADTTTVVTLEPNAAYDLPSVQQRFLTVEVPPNSLIGDGGQKLESGQVGVSVVPPELVRDMLPPGVLQHTFDVTVQAPGIATFSTPAPMTFPNVFNAPPGTKQNFLSFDHTTGRLVIEGTATVSADGLSVRTDPGTGITHPGWHGLTPPGGPNDAPEEPDPFCQEELLAADEEDLTVASLSALGLHSISPHAPSDVAPAQTEGLQNYLFSSDQGEFTLVFRHTAPPPPTKSKAICPPDSGPKPLLIRIRVFGNEMTKDKPNRFLEGIDKAIVRPILLRAGGEKKIKVTLTKLLPGIKKIEQDRLYGAKLVVQGWEQGRPQDLLINRVLYIGRFLDAADANHTDGVLSMADTATGANGKSGVVRKRSFETRGIPLSLRRVGTDPSPFSVAEKEIHFAPTGRGPRSIAELEVVDPENRVVGSLKAEGDAKLQEFFVDGARIRAVLTNAAAGQIAGVTEEQKTFLNASGALDRIAPKILQGVDALLEPYAQGISRTSVESAIGVKITAFRAAEAANPANVFETLLGKSDAIDICSLDGSVCLVPGGVPVPHPLMELLKLVSKVSTNELAFRLSKSMNHRAQGSFEMYVDNFLTAKRATGQPYILSEDQLVLMLVNTVVHETGHTLGLIHTFNKGVSQKTMTCGCALGPNGQPVANYLSDVMAQGEVTSQPLFPVSGSALKVALGLDYAPGEARLAVNYLAANVRGAKKLGIKGLLMSFDGNDGNEEYLVPDEPGALLAFSGSDNPELVSSQNFGRVLADGPGGSFADQVVLLSNVGDRPVTLSSIRVVGTAEEFKIPDSLAGTQIPVQESLAVPLRFDPTRTGEAFGTLILTHDGLDGITEIDLSGFGFTAGADIRVLVENNNAGGARISDPPTVLRGFGSITNIGMADLLLTAISDAAQGDTFFLSGLPAFNASNPLRIRPAEAITFDMQFLPQRIGLQRGQIQIHSNDAATPIFELLVVGTGLPATGSSLEYGEDFVAMDSPDFPTAPPLRAKSGSSGNFEFFLPPNQRYHYAIFDPVSGLIAHGLGITESSGRNTPIGVPVFLPSRAPDSDGDGLPDDIEFAIGTNPNKADTDGEGLDDFAAISQGLDPFGGRALPLGIIGQLAIAGEAKEVVVMPPFSNGENPVAVVAAGTGGLAVIDVGNPTQPILLNQLPLPGDATDIAVDLDLRIAVVAANDGGLHIVEIADPASPRLFNTCFAKTEHVEVVNGVAYFVSGGVLRAVDLLSRELLPSLASPLGSVLGMTREGTMLYFTDPGSNLRLVDVSGRTMKLRGQLLIGAPFVRSPIRRPVVGNGIAYLTLSDTFAGGGGYATVDVSNPDAPTIIRGTDVPRMDVPPFQYVPGKGMALNGSGHGLLIGWLLTAGNYVNRLNVMNVSDPARTYVLVTSFNLPAFPQSVTIAGNMAYVACGPAGLVMVNYLNFDAQGQPPTVAISAGVADADPNQPGVQVVEGTPVPIQAAVRDDLQAGNVQLLVNGQVAQTAISFPFNLEAVAPSAAENGGRFTVQVRATDSGGNVGVSEPLVIEALPDARPFAVKSLDLADGHIVPTDNGVIEVAFAKPVHPRSVTAENFFVVNSRGQAIRPSGFDLVEAGRSVRMRLETLPPDDYTLVLRSAAIRDYRGNALGAADFTSRFTTRAFTIRWTGLGGLGQLGRYVWRNPANWCPERVPGPEDAVYINVPNAEIDINWVKVSSDPGGNGVPLRVELRSLVSNEEIALNYIELHVKEYIQVNNYFSFLASYLRDSLLLSGPNTFLRHFNRVPGGGGVSDRGFGALLDGVTLKGDFRLFGSFFHVINQLTLEGNLHGILNPAINATSTLGLTRDTVFKGPGTFHNISLSLSRENLDGANQIGAVGTISSNVTFRGALEIAMLGRSAKVINRGKLLADEPPLSALGSFYSRVWMAGDGTGNSDQHLINEGTIEISNGYRLLVEGDFNSSLINRGVLKTADRGFLWLSVLLQSPKIRCDAGGVVQISGRNRPWITESGLVSELSGPGRWMAWDTEFQGGTIRLTDGAILEGTALFKNVTFEGELHNYDWNSRRKEWPEYVAGYGNQVQVFTNLTLNGLIAFHRKSPEESGGRLSFFGNRCKLDGQGRVEFESSSFYNQVLNSGLQGLSGLLTIGPNITLHGKGLIIGNIGGIDFGSPPVVENQGIILANQPGDQLRFSTFAFTNSGTIHLGTNNVVTIAGKFNQSAAGHLQFDVAGTTSAATHGQIQMSSSAATLGGVLNVNVLAPFQPESGDAFSFLNALSVAGRFSSIIAVPLAGDLVYQPVYRTSNFTLEVRPPGGPGPVQGPGHALDFSTAAGGTQVFHNPQLNTFPMSITAWMKTGPNSGAYVPLVSKFVSNPPQGYALFLNNGRVGASYYVDAANYLSDGTVGLDQRFIADNQWHHVAYTVDASGGKIYIDGVLMNTHAWVGTAGPVQTTEILRFGAARLAGQLDEVTLWQRALSQTDLEQNQKLLLQGNEAGLLGYWHFDEGRGEIASDSSGHGFNAVVGFVGAAKWVESTAPVKSSP